MAVIIPEGIKHELFPKTERRFVSNTFGPFKVAVGGITPAAADIIRLTPEMQGKNFVAFSHIYIAADSAVMVASSKIVLCKESDNAVLADLVPAASGNTSAFEKVDLANVDNKASRKVWQDRNVPCYIGIQFPSARNAIAASKNVTVALSFSIHNTA